MAFLSCGRHISKYHIYQKACAKTRARITLLMVPPITTTTINFSGKKTRPGTFCAGVWEQGPGPGLQSPPRPGRTPPLPRAGTSGLACEAGLPVPRGDIFPPPITLNQSSISINHSEHLFIGHSFGALKARKINLMERLEHFSNLLRDYLGNLSTEPSTAA